MFKLGIIIPVYNKAFKGQLKQCIKSIIKQTNQHFRCFLIDDGSLDKSAKICRKMALKHPSILTFISLPHSGVSHTRNIGLINTLRDKDITHIWFCDADDTIMPNAVEKIEEFYTSTPEAKILHVNTHCAKESLPLKKHHPEYNIIPAGHYTLDSEKIDIYTAWSLIFNKAFVESTGCIFNEKVSYGEDMLFLMHLFVEAKEFYCIEDQLYSYRAPLGNNLSTYLSPEREQSSRDAYLEFENELLNSNKAYPIILKKIHEHLEWLPQVNSFRKEEKEKLEAIKTEKKKNNWFTLLLHKIFKKNKKEQTEETTETEN